MHDKINHYQRTWCFFAVINLKRECEYWGKLICGCHEAMVPVCLLKWNCALEYNAKSRRSEALCCSANCGILFNWVIFYLTKTAYVVATPWTGFLSSFDWITLVMVFADCVKCFYETHFKGLWVFHCVEDIKGWNFC